MGKADIRKQLYVFLENGKEHAFKEMRPMSVVGLGFLPGNRTTKMILRPLILRNMNEIEMSVKNSLMLAMDYAEELAQGEAENSEKYRRKFLESDIFYTNYEGDRKDELREMLVRHFDEMAHDMAPLIETEEDSFWEATRGSYDKYETEELLRHHFSFVEKVIDEFGEGMSMTSTLGPLGFDYTDEALRVLPKVERRLRHEIIEEVDDAYGSRYNEVDAGEGGTVATGRKEADGMSGEVEKKETKRVTKSMASEPSGEEVEKLRRRLEELEDENKELLRRLEEERERREDLQEKLEEKRDSYSAEDWLG